MKKCALVLLLLALCAPARAIESGGSMSVAVSAQFVRASSVESTWEAQFTDADGNPASETDWVNLALTARIVNGSSQPMYVSWQLPADVLGVTALTPEAMQGARLNLSEFMEVELRFSRDPDIPLPAEGMKLEYVVESAADE